MPDNTQPKYVGMFPGTKPFRMKSLTPDEKNMCIEKVDAILDNLDDIQGLLGLKEYVKQLAHWQAVRSGIENEY